jgi:phospholipid transport system substrate-binding protein
MRWRNLVMKLWWTGFLPVLLLGISVARALPPGPETVVRSATEDIYQALEAECRSQQGVTTARLYQLVDQILVPHADFDRMSQWVMGQYWHSASDSQRQAFISEFKLLLARTYATAIRTVTPEQIRFLPQHEAASDNKAVVSTEVRAPGAPVKAINYYLYLNHDRWLVYDVQIDGISMVANYRSALADEFRDRGVQGLIDSLKEKNLQQPADTRLSSSNADCR